MESISITPITAASIGRASYFCLFRRTAVSRTGNSIWFSKGRKTVGGGFSVYAENPPRKPRPEFASYDQMELKFGKLLGEDPKLTLPKLHDYVLNKEKMASAPTIDADKADSGFKSSPPPASLLKKPRRLEKPAKVLPQNDGLQTSEEKFSSEGYDANMEPASLPTASSLDDHEDADWARAEDLVKTGEKVEVNLLISSC